MSQDPIRRRVRELLTREAQDGRLRGLAGYQRLFKGFEKVVAEEFEALGEVPATPTPSKRAPPSSAWPHATSDATGSASGIPSGHATPSSEPGPETAPDHAAPGPTEEVSPPPTAGRRSSQYARHDEVARGGMGVVYRVEDESLRRTLAMKTIFDHHVGNKRIAASLVEEAQVTAQLDHPGVVAVHELGDDPEHGPFFTMKLVRGRTLLEIIRLCHAGEEGWSLPRGVQLLVRICETLAYAHSKGVIHRDLKPANIMVGNFGEVYVMDWGLARVIRSDDDGGVRSSGVVRTDRAYLGVGAGAESEGSLGGTPAYMSPEQATGNLELLDARSDVYGIGALLYELLCGRPPYADTGAASTADLLRAVLRGPPTPLGALAPRVPDELCSIVDCAMARRAPERYQSAQDLREDLQAYVDGRVVQAHETGPIAELQKWVGRNRALAGAIASAVALLVVGLVVVAGLNVRVRQQAEETSRHAYRASLAAATSDIQDDDMDAAREHLERAPEHLRGWEWGVLHGRLDESVMQMDGRAFAWREDGHRLVTLGSDGGVREWDVATGDAVDVGRFDVGLYTADSVADVLIYSDCRETGIAGYGYSAVRLLDADAGSPHLADLVLRPDGSDRIAFGRHHVAYQADDGYHMRDLATGGEVVVDLGTAWPMTRAWTADESRALVIAGDAQEPAYLLGRIVDTRSLEVVATIDIPDSIDNVFTPDGAVVISACADGRLVAHDAATGAPTAWIEIEAHQGRLGSVAIGPEGRLLASGADDSIVHIWDMATGARLRTLRGHSESVRKLAFSPDGRMLASAGGDGVRIWDLAAPQSPTLAGHASYVYALAFSPDGTTIATGGWDAYTGADGSLRIWDASSGEPIVTLGVPDECVFWAEFSPDGQRLYTCGGDRESGWADSPVRIWDTATGELIRSLSRRAHVAALTHDEKTIICSRTESLTFVEIADDTAVGVVAAEGASRLRLSRDGKLLCASTGEGCTVIDMATRSAIRHIPLSRRTWDATVSPDGTQVLTAGGGDDTVQFWDIETGERVGELVGHGNEVLCVAFSPDGSRILTGGRDRTIRVWHPDRREQIARFSAHDNYVYSLAFSPTGDTVASASGDGTIRLWESATAAARFDAAQERRRVAARIEERVNAALDTHGDARRAAQGLEGTLNEAEMRVARQLLLTESVRRRR